MIALGVITLCAFVLDAFEIVFVIIPNNRCHTVADARWVSVLVLLALQSSFLLPPFGYGAHDGARFGQILDLFALWYAR